MSQRDGTELQNNYWGVEHTINLLIFGQSAVSWLKYLSELHYFKVKKYRKKHISYQSYLGASSFD